MSNSLNRLQQGGRSTGLEAFLRQCGGRPDQFFALGESNRLPREGVDRCHGSVAAWSGRYASLSSALRKSNLAPCGGRTFKASMYRGIKEIRFQKSVSPSPRRVLGPQTGDDAVRVEMTARRGTFKASISRLISEMRFWKSVFPSPRHALGPKRAMDVVRVKRRQARGTFKASMCQRINEMRFRKGVLPSPRRPPPHWPPQQTTEMVGKNSPLPRAHGEGRCEETFHTLRGTCLPAMAWLVSPLPARGPSGATWSPVSA